MMKLTKRIHILFLSLIVVFLFACSEAQKKASSPDSAANVSVQENVAQQPNPAEAISAQQPSSSGNTEAKSRLQFAQNYMKMAKKGIISYSQTVAICRGIIKDYPDTEYAQQARELLQEIPEDLRAQYNLTNAELGLE